MNVAVFVHLRMQRIHDFIHTEFFRNGAAVLQHRTHCGITVNIGVFTLDIAVLTIGIRICDLPDRFHDAGFGVTDSRTLITIQNVCLCGFRMSFFDQHFNDRILNILYIRGCVKV